MKDKKKIAIQKSCLGNEQFFEAITYYFKNHKYSRK
jgi:hypothetical protein